MNGTGNARTNVLMVVLTVLLAAAVLVSVHLGAAITPTGQHYPWNPLRLLEKFLLHHGKWPRAASWAGIALGLVALALFTLLLVVLARRAERKRSNMSAHLATRRETLPFRARARRKEAARLHPGPTDLPSGLPVGTILSRRRWIFQGWEDTGVYVFGNRQGKTSAVVVRHIAAAPGACVLTSTKPDGVRETLALRQGRGNVFLFDPNGIYRSADQAPDFVFNPLDTVTSYRAAQELAGIFEASTKTGEERGGDAQFDSSGRNLLACAFLAAARGELPLSTVWQWLSDQDGEEIANRLAAQQMAGPAAVVSGILATHERTRTSTFATAHRMASALAYDELLRWTDTPGVRRLDPEAFVSSTDTLILLAAQETGSAGAILTALVRAVVKAGEQVANRNGGRLPVPLVVELDECANIVRWPELPALYSTSGSRGIILSAYFQNRSQAYEAFGRNGWDTLWSNARIAVLGPGVKDEEFLRSLSSLAGEHDEMTFGSSTAQDGRTSTSTNTRRLSTLTSAQLAALPRWQMVLFPANGRPVLLKAKPWFDDRGLKNRIRPRSPLPEALPVTTREDAFVEGIKNG